MCVCHRVLWGDSITGVWSHLPDHLPSDVAAAGRALRRLPARLLRLLHRSVLLNTTQLLLPLKVLVFMALFKSVYDFNDVNYLRETMMTTMMMMMTGIHLLYPCRYDASPTQLCNCGHRHTSLQSQTHGGHLHHVQKGELTVYMNSIMNPSVQIFCCQELYFLHLIHIILSLFYDN